MASEAADKLNPTKSKVTSLITKTLRHAGIKKVQQQFAQLMIILLKKEFWI